MPTEPEIPNTGPLRDLVVLDLSRVLAGPWASQMLGDLGAEVIKVEARTGDETRRWGPPFVDDSPGSDAAYFTCANRNKLSVAIDFSAGEGAALVRALAAQADVVIENFKVGSLARYGLDYAALAAINPRLVYCSITGFGQDGPYATRGGYDFLIQGMGGLMSITGRPDGEPGAGPLRAGVAVADLFTGMYAGNAILAALHHRDRTGEGQHIDCALLDCQMAVLANQAANYFVGGEVPGRTGNAHPNIVPYRDFATRDGHVLVAVGTDRQFRALCGLLGRDDLAATSDYASNSGRQRGRVVLEAQLQDAIAGWSSAALLAAMEAAAVPGGPINSIAQAFADPHAIARGLARTLARSDGIEVRTGTYPAVLSKTPASNRSAPPRLGEHGDAVLARRLGLDAAELTRLRDARILGGLPA